MRLLCLSNGHGEDEVAVRILRELQQYPNAREIYALPLVGEGHAYQKLGISLIGAVKTMPSGGFVYMDRRQLGRDIQGGLLQLILAQFQAIRSWANPGQKIEARAQGTGDREQETGDRRQETADRISSPDLDLILAVGDIVPLIFAWLSGLPYAFVGTAKSEYHLRDEKGLLERQSWFDDRLERWTNCVYLPWERWLMRRPHCKAVFPRDRLTAHFLQQRGVPAYDLGNPMMDGLAWHAARAKNSATQSKEPPGKAEEDSLSNLFRFLNPEFASSSSESAAKSAPAKQPVTRLTLLLLPGSRSPEAYHNWEILLQAANNLITETERPLLFLAAIAPTLSLEPLQQALNSYRWQQISSDTYLVGSGERQATLVLAQNRFAEFLHRGEVAIAMTGTGTEQFVGFGKPAIAIAGAGPQFTPRFAEAQTRLLGPSIFLIATPNQASSALRTLLQNPDHLHLIAENGRRRMGEPGAAKRIAAFLMRQPTKADII